MVAGWMNALYVAVRLGSGVFEELTRYGRRIDVSHTYHRSFPRESSIRSDLGDPVVYPREEIQGWSFTNSRTNDY